MALAYGSGSVPKTRTLAVVSVAAVSAASAGMMTRLLPMEVLAGAAVGLVIVLLISLDPMAALGFFALTRATLETFQDNVIAKPGGISISPTDVIAAAFLGGATLWLVRQARAGNQFWRHPIALCAFVVLGVSVFGLGYSSSAALGAKDLLKWTSAFAGFLVITAARPDPQRLRRLLSFIVAGAVFPVTLGLWQFLHSVGKVVASHGGLRVQGTFIHPNDYGVYLVLVAVAVVGLRPTVSGRARTAVSLIGLATFLSIMLALSRTAWAGFAAVLLVIGWQYRRLLLGVVVGVLGVGLAAPRIFARATDVLHSENDPGFAVKTGRARAANSLLARFNIWSGEIKAWKARPFLGDGWGSTYSAEPKGAHNDYLRALAETGILGFLAYLGFLIAIIRTSVRAARGRTDLPLAFLGLTFAYVVESAALNVLGMQAYLMYFWLLAGITYLWAETVDPAGGDTKAPERGLASATTP